MEIVKTIVSFFKCFKFYAKLNLVRFIFNATTEVTTFAILLNTKLNMYKGKQLFITYLLVEKTYGNVTWCTVLMHLPSRKVDATLNELDVRVWHLELKHRNLHTSYASCATRFTASRLVEESQLVPAAATCGATIAAADNVPCLKWH